MAITLNVDLTDEQQAVMEQYAPDGTGAEKIAWAEGVAADGLKLAVLDVAKQAGRAAAYQLRKDALEDINNAWPEDTGEPATPEGATP